MSRPLTGSIAVALCALSAPAFAQTADVEDPLPVQPGPAGPGPTVFDGDFLSIGIGAAWNPSYSGSDDYGINVLPIIQASVWGIDINPRPAGLAIDFVPDAEEGISFDAGPLLRIRGDRDNAEAIKDEIVQRYGELDTAIEVGGSVGMQIPALLNPFDSLGFNLDAAWDVAGAHGGMFASPSVSYFTPLSRGTAASLTVSATFVDDSFADYYYSVPEVNTLLPDADLLPGFQAEGGMHSIGTTLFVAQDLSGDVTDGGFSLIGLAGWSKLVGDPGDTPFTSIRGNDDQIFLAAGVGYTF